MTTVLVVAPHGMDELLGCGGTISGLLAAGRKVQTLVLFGDGTGADGHRRNAAHAAASLLGTAAPHYASFPENRGDSVPLLDIVTIVESAISTLQAGEIYIPHGDNLNVDHQTAFRAAVTAARPAPRSPVRAIYAYEVLSSTDWAPPSGNYFQPTRFSDISSTLESKIAALACYASDLRDAPHSRSIDGVRALARHRGFSVGFEAAEAFVVIRQLSSP